MYYALRSPRMHCLQSDTKINRSESLLQPMLKPGHHPVYNKSEANLAQYVISCDSPNYQ